MSRRQIGVVVLAGVALLAAAAAGWLLSPPNQYVDGVNEQPPWSVPAGVACVLLSAASLVGLYRLARPGEALRLVLGVAGPLSVAAFLIAFGLRLPTRQIVGADIGGTAYLLFVTPLIVALVGVAIIMLVTGQRQRRAA
jgi:hypothetical protein